MSRKCLVCCAIGEKYVKLTKGMIASFMKHNPDWEVMEFYDDGLRNILPIDFQGFTDFDTCEVGRFCAIQKALEKYDTALYCDGDMRWYGRYETSTHGMVLTPHYVTKQAQKGNRHLEFRTGFVNTGLIEMSKTDETNEILDYVIREVKINRNRLMFNGNLWLQNFVHMIPLVGFDCVYSEDVGVNVAYWNLMRGDRALVKRDDGYAVVAIDGRLAPLKCFHFSSCGMRHLDGLYAGELKKEYENEGRR